MSRKPTPRVRLPAQAKAGEIIEIKTLIAHEMETGQRRNAQGQPIPRQIINTFIAEFNGKVVMQATWHPAISANPYQAFYYRAKESGEFTFSWKDDNGETYTAKSRLTVA